MSESPAGSARPLEQATVAAVPDLVGGLVAALPMVVVPASWSRSGVFLVLGALVAVGLMLSIRLAPFPV